MTDDELDRLTAPTRYTYLAGAGIMRVGMTLADVEKPERAHVCGRCRNPWTRAGNPACPNNDQGVGA